MTCSLYHTQNTVKKVLLEKLGDLLSSPSETSVKFQGFQTKQEQSHGNTNQLTW